MFNRHTIHTLCLLILLALLPHQAAGATNGKNPQFVVLTLPADVVLASLQKALPLDIPSQSRQLQGEITVESLDRLVIHDNIITVRGVLSGKNMTVNTSLAGQDIQLRVGEVRLPMTCDLQTRFDPVKRMLFVTPRFSDTGHNANGQQDTLAPLLAAMGGREYPIDLDHLETVNLKVGTKLIPITMETAKITGTDNALTFHLLPRVGNRR